MLRHNLYRINIIHYKPVFNVEHMFLFFFSLRRISLALKKAKPTQYLLKMGSTGLNISTTITTRKIIINKLKLRIIFYFYFWPLESIFRLFSYAHVHVHGMRLLFICLEFSSTSKCILISIILGRFGLFL